MPKKIADKDRLLKVALKGLRKHVGLYESTQGNEFRELWYPQRSSPESKRSKSEGNPAAHERIEGWKELVEGWVPESAAQLPQEAAPSPLGAEGPGAAQGGGARWWGPGAGQLLLGSHLTVGQDGVLRVHCVCHLHAVASSIFLTITRDRGLLKSKL